MIGDMIRQYRDRCGLSRDELAQAIGVSGESIDLWETHQAQPDIEGVVRMAKTFGISTDELLFAGNAETLDETGYTETAEVVEQPEEEETVTIDVAASMPHDEETKKPKKISIVGLFKSCLSAQEPKRPGP